ncbi:putative F-box protein At4g22660 [Lotus japonicus]|uniref:putative F-box protein At4g22660 n=1 Tax=Lotus japonicus TaxID=34305 RepID=UPI0025861ADB|nr:putative F-box protein At4g22660 [Lotus japonicus]
MAKKKVKSGWSDMLPELLDLVLNKLVLMDYLKCRQVCRSWRNIVNDAIKNKCPFVPQLPSLLLLPPAFDCNENLFTLMDITQYNHINQQFMIPPQAWEGDSVFVLLEEDGWLMFEDNHQVLWIFNPVSQETYKLPQIPLLHIEDQNPPSIIPITIRFALFSSQSLLVVICFSYVDDKDGLISQLIFCTVDNDKSWTSIDKNETRFEFTEMVLLGWKLYAMNADTMTIFNLKDPNVITTEKLVMPLPKVEVDEDGGESVVCSLARDSTCGQVLLVFFKTKGLEEVDIPIFKLDMSSRKWIKLDNLNGRALFLDCGRAQVISTANFNVPPEFIRRKDNCIFFSIYLDDMNPYIGVYFLKEKTSELLNVNFPSSITSCRALWFTPCPW